MHKSTILSALALVVAGPVAAQDLVLDGATLVDPETGKNTANSVVIVRDGRVERIGRSGALRLPAGVPVVDAKGKWLVPGYIDGHVHFFQSGGLYTRPDAVDLRAVRPYEAEIAAVTADLDDIFTRYLASGITAVADVGGPMSNFAVRDRARANLRAPHVVVAGPLISTWQPPVLSEVADPPIIAAKSPDEARALVRAQTARKPDFVKIWYVVMPNETAAQHLPVVKAAIDEAHAAGLRVAVHATELETARAALTAGADILVHGVEDKPVDDAFIALLKRSGAIYTSTIDVADGYMRSLTRQHGFIEREIALADPEVIGSLLSIGGLSAGAVPEWLAKLKGRPLRTEPMAMLQANLKRMHAAGVRVALGTDAGNIGTLPGPSIYREFRRLADAGMTPREVLASATVDAAPILAKGSRLGRIEKGGVADMVVLDADPLANVDNLSRIAWVVRGGRSYRQAELVSQSPADVVQRQVNAYNAHDLDGFLATYTPDAEVMDWPNASSLKGVEAMRKVYGGMFAQLPDLHARIGQRIVIGNVVIDEEIVTGLPGAPPLRAVAIYEVTNGRISSARMIAEPPPPKPNPAN